MGITLRLKMVTMLSILLSVEISLRTIVSTCFFMQTSVFCTSVLLANWSNGTAGLLYDIQLYHLNKSVNLLFHFQMPSFHKIRFYKYSHEIKIMTLITFTITLKRQLFCLHLASAVFINTIVHIYTFFR